MSVSKFGVLVRHIGHRIECNYYHNAGEAVNVSVECMDCNEVLFSRDGGINSRLKQVIIHDAIKQAYDFFKNAPVEELETVENAIETRVLNQLIKENIERLIDLDLFQERLEQEGNDKEKLSELAKI